MELEPETEEIDSDPEAVARELAEAGQVKEAEAIFHRILELEPDIDLDPDTKEIENRKRPRGSGTKVGSRLVEG